MDVDQRLTVFAIALAIVSSIAPIGCKRKAVEEKPPPDHFAINELPLGPDKAFSLPLPRGARVVTEYDEVQVFTGYSPEVLANFVRYHVQGGKVVVGANSTQFDEVFAKEDAQKALFIDVRAADGIHGASQMIVRAARGGDPSVPNDEHFKRLGLTPDGKLADPKHLQ
jgi:hypothetical protein